MVWKDLGFVFCFGILKGFELDYTPKPVNEVKRRPGFCFQHLWLVRGRVASTTGSLCCGEDKASQASQGNASRFTGCAAWVLATHLWASCEEMHILGRGLLAPCLTS